MSDILLLSQRIDICGLTKTIGIDSIAHCFSEDTIGAVIYLALISACPSWNLGWIASNVDCVWSGWLAKISIDENIGFEILGFGDMAKFE